MTFFLVLNQNLEKIRLAVKLNHCNFATGTELPKVKSYLNKEQNPQK